MEEQLIGEVERRPVLYDKSVQVVKKMSARDEAWREVADILKQSEAEVKKRWRTLRDSFMRFLRLQRTSGHNGKKMWIHYNAMLFLIPHIAPKDFKMEIPMQGRNEDNMMDNNNRPELHPANMVSIASDMYEVELTTPVCPCSYNGFGQQDAQSMMPAKPDEPTDPAADSDEHFALSCVAALRRLPARKNAEVRMKIMHMLYEAEYGEEPVLE